MAGFLFCFSSRTQLSWSVGTNLGVDNVLLLLMLRGACLLFFFFLVFFFWFFQAQLRFVHFTRRQFFLGHHLRLVVAAHPHCYTNPQLRSTHFFFFWLCEIISSESHRSRTAWGIRTQLFGWGYFPSRALNSRLGPLQARCTDLTWALTARVQSATDWFIILSHDYIMWNLKYIIRKGLWQFKHTSTTMYTST